MKVRYSALGERKLLWVYPHPDHPNWQHIWRIVHWRRWRRFMKYLEEQKQEYYRQMGWLRR